MGYGHLNVAHVKHVEEEGSQGWHQEFDTHPGSAEARGCQRCWRKKLSGQPRGMSMYRLGGAVFSNNGLTFVHIIFWPPAVRFFVFF